jgi:alkylated DNA nucleotide flippase Atl1
LTAPTASASPDSADFGAAVRAVVQSIPSGCVMTYGDVAAVLGSKASRQVGRIMALEGGDLPWWRVVRAGGLPASGHEARALEHYRAEGTPLVARSAAAGSADGSRSDWRLDMRRARWSPPDVAGSAADEDDPDFPRDPF